MFFTLVRDHEVNTGHWLDGESEKEPSMWSYLQLFLRLRRGLFVHREAVLALEEWQTDTADCVVTDWC